MDSYTTMGPDVVITLLAITVSSTFHNKQFKTSKVKSVNQIKIRACLRFWGKYCAETKYKDLCQKMKNY